LPLRSQIEEQIEPRHDRRENDPPTPDGFGRMPSLLTAAFRQGGKALLRPRRQREQLSPGTINEAGMGHKKEILAFFCSIGFSSPGVHIHSFFIANPTPGSQIHP